MADMDQRQMDRGGEKGAIPLFEGRGGTILTVMEEEKVNASGHRDQLQRQYSIWSICDLALTIDNAWVALGGSIVVAVCMTPIQSPIELLILIWLTMLQPMVGRRESCTSIWRLVHTTVLSPHASLRYAMLSLNSLHRIHATFIRDLHSSFLQS